jgi:hypothetical protein
VGAPADDEEAKRNVEKAVEKILEHEKSLREAKDAALAADSQDFYMIVVFRSYDERKAFTDKHQLEDNRYQSGDAFTKAVDD